MEFNWLRIFLELKNVLRAGKICFFLTWKLEDVLHKMALFLDTTVFLPRFSIDTMCDHQTI